MEIIEYVRTNMYYKHYLVGTKFIIMQMVDALRESEYELRPFDTSNIFYKFGVSSEEQQITLTYHHILCSSVAKYLKDNNINVKYDEKGTIDEGVKLGVCTDDDLYTILRLVEAKF